MNAPYERQRDIVPCCIHLRTKTQYVMQDERQAGPGFIKVTTTGIYWCNRTAVASGPDDALARPELCQHGRGCYTRLAVN